MKTLFRGSLLVLSSTLLFACGDRDAEDVGQGIENRFADNALMGSWVSECRGSDLLDMSERQVMNFEGNQLTYVRHFYEEDDCQTEAVTLEYQGEFSIEELEGTNPAEANAIDLTYSEALVRVHTEGGKDVLETVNFCGHEAWPVGQERNLTDVTTDALCPLSDLPMTKYDLYHVSEDQLHFGTQPGQGGPNTASERPTEIDQEIALTREEEG